MAWQFTICLALTACLFTSNVKGRKEAELEPSMPKVEAGRSLNATCTLLTANYAADSLYFIWHENGGNQSTIPKHYVHLVNSSQVRLILPSVSIEHDTDNLACWAPNRSMALDAVYVQVGYKPKPPTNINAVFKNWENFVIKWMHEENPIFKTSTTVYWKLNARIPHSKITSSDTLEFRQCNDVQHDGTRDNMEYHSCSAEIHRHVEDGDYFVVKITRRNAIGIVHTREKMFYCGDIIKPAKVKSLISENIQADSTTLKWYSPKKNRTLIYHVNTSCRRAAEMQTSFGPSNLNNLSIEVTGLPPNTPCKISVTAQSEKSRLLSTRSNLKIKTLPAVPGALPRTSPGGFENVVRNGLRHIRIYWQPVPSHQQHGNISKYRVTTSWDFGHSKLMEEIYDANQFHFEVKKLELKKAYNMSVAAATSVGYNSSLEPFTAVFLPAQSAVPDAPNNITAIIENGVVKVRWMQDNKTGYTGYWCCESGGHCVDPLQWKHNIDSPWEVPVDRTAHSNKETTCDLEHYRYGVSTDGIFSSGIAWSDCVYDILKLSDPPTVKSHDSGKSTIAMVLKQPEECVKRQGYIYAFLLVYCASDGKICTGEEKRKTIHRFEEETKVLLDDLSENTKYKVSIQSLTFNVAESYPSSVKYISTEAVIPLTQAQLAGIAVVCVILLAFGLVGIGCCIRKCRKKVRQLCEYLKIPIRSPEGVKNEYDDFHQYAIPSHVEPINSNGKDVPEKPPVPDRLNCSPNVYTKDSDDSGMGADSDSTKPTPLLSLPTINDSAPASEHLPISGFVFRNIDKNDDRNKELGSQQSFSSESDGLLDESQSSLTLVEGSGSSANYAPTRVWLQGSASPKGGPPDGSALHTSSTSVEESFSEDESGDYKGVNLSNPITGKNQTVSMPSLEYAGSTNADEDSDYKPVLLSNRC